MSDRRPKSKDPVFAHIEAYKAARAALEKATRHVSKVEAKADAADRKRGMPSTQFLSNQFPQMYIPENSAVTGNGCNFFWPGDVTSHIARTFETLETLGPKTAQRIARLRKPAEREIHAMLREFNASRYRRQKRAGLIAAWTAHELAENAFADATKALFATAPTTQAGLVALLEFGTAEFAAEFDVGRGEADEKWRDLLRTLAASVKQGVAKAA